MSEEQIKNFYDRADRCLNAKTKAEWETYHLAPGEWKILLNEIEQLQQENKQLKKQKQKAINRLNTLSGFNRTGKYNGFKLYGADFKDLVEILERD